MRMNLRCHPLLTSSLLAALLTACATGSYTPPVASVEMKQHERIVNKPFDETWTSLVDYASRAFFSIDTFEKASGLMTLSFGSSEPWRYIDCGQFKAQAASKVIDMPYVKYVTERRQGKLDGRMNILVKPVGANTLVRVNARYIYIVPAQPSIPAHSWTFDSGGEATVTIPDPVPGSIPTRTCRPTYAAEKEILEAVSK